MDEELMPFRAAAVTPPDVLDVRLVRWVALTRDDEAPVEAEFDEEAELDDGEAALFGISMASRLLN